MCTIFKVFIEFVTVLLLFYVLVFWPRGMWDLSSPNRDWTCTPCIGRRSSNHWTTREVPIYLTFLKNFSWQCCKILEEKIVWMIWYWYDIFIMYGWYIYWYDMIFIIYGWYDIDMIFHLSCMDDMIFIDMIWYL